MTTPGAPDPHQPGGYQPPPPGGYQPPPASYPPPPGYPPPPTGGYPPVPGSYPPPPPAGAYQPPAGPAYGAAQAFSPPGAPAAYPPPGFPPPVVPAKKSRKGLIIGIVAVVVIAIVAITVIVQNKTATTSASVGSCIKITSATTINPDTSQEDCSSQLAVFVVTESGGSGTTCDPNEASYVEGKDTNNPTSRVCLRYNLKVGECIDLGLLDSSVPKKVTCSSSNSSSTVKLASLSMDSSDGSTCTGGTKGLPLVKRNIVYCFGPAA